MYAAAAVARAAAAAERQAAHRPSALGRPVPSGGDFSFDAVPHLRDGRQSVVRDCSSARRPCRTR